MSRCFPFPPPGYEKKLRVEDVTLLAKEKGIEIKEKKHKKDKDKDKERKDGKEKDRKKSKDKHKEKDKDKHTHKDRDKKSGKKRSRDEKRLEGDRPSVEKVGSNSPQSSCVQELEQRISFVDAAARNQSVHTIGDEGKTEFSGGVASRNGAYWTEANGGLEQRGNGQQDTNTSKFPKVVFSNGAEQRTVQIGRPLENNISKSIEGKDVQKQHISNSKGEKSEVKSAKRHKGEAKIVPQEAAVVRELEQRIRDENGAVGSQHGAKANVNIQKRAQNVGNVANGNATAFSYTKEFSEFGDASRTLENGQNGSSHLKVPKVSVVHNNQAKVPKVAIVNNLKTKERGNEGAGVVDTGMKSPLEGGMRRNGYYEKSAVDNKKIIQLKDEDQNKLRKQEKVKEKSDNVAGPSRSGQNVSESADNSRRYTFKMVDKTAEVITGKRKETETNGILQGDEMQPSKFQRTIQSQPFPQNGRSLKTSATITLSSSKPMPASGLRLDGEGHKSNRTVPSKSPSVLKESPTTSVKPMGPPLGQPTLGQSSLGSAKPFISPETNRTGTQEPPVGPMICPSSAGKVDRKTGSQEPHLGSTKPPLTGGKVKGEIKGHGSPSNATKTSPQTEKIHETVGRLESAKPPVTPEKFNGIIAAHGSPLASKKPPSTSGKEKRKHKSSSKPPTPHPDTKYLSQILSVPKMEELPEFDDSEWLFESKTLSSKESGDVSGKDRDEQVWSKAVHIESADIYALPYVIPY
ncbi:hypothetical protein vseg_010376 [Gypsophila vaccaria]